MTLDVLFNAMVWYLVFVLAVTFHEAAHAWVARLGGDDTAYAGGQVSLNPLPHMRREPIGMIALPLVSVFLIGWPFGYASAPYDPAWASRHPKRAAVMALAGPGANLLLVVVCIVLVRLGILGGLFSIPHSVGFTQIVGSEPGGMGEVFGYVISVMFTLNLILLVLNALPIPPMDGSVAVTLFMSDDTAQRFQRVVANPAFGLVGLLVAWRVVGPLVRGVFGFILGIVYPGVQFG